MYGVLKNRIAQGGYPLADMLYRVKKFYALGDLTQEQMDELLSLVREHATADAERPEILKMLQSLAARVEALEKALSAPAQQPEYALWTPWDGISDKYGYGAVVSHNDKLWQSVFAGQNVWEPGSAGTESLWVAYTPEAQV